MINKVNFNGKLIEADQPVFHADNRSFKYGDGLFETIRIFNGKVPFLNYHFNRLEEGMSGLKFNVPAYYSASFFENEIQKLTSGKGNHRVRLTVFRSAGGFYTPKDDDPQFFIENDILADSEFKLNARGIHLGLFDEIKIPSNSISHLKTCNSLPYILAGIFSKENGFDDCLLLNGSGNIAECSSSNLFIVKNKTLLTPSLSEACVAGTMRSIIIEMADQLNFNIYEAPIQLSALKGAEEIWLTNAVQGIIWVEQFGASQYKNKIAEEFVQSLNGKLDLKNV